eukprot:scaffold21966_cov26-Tisochrysis_lutea.AAC.2
MDRSWVTRGLALRALALPRGGARACLHEGALQSLARPICPTALQLGGLGLSTSAHLEHFPLSCDARLDVGHCRLELLRLTHALCQLRCEARPLAARGA